MTDQQKPRILLAEDEEHIARLIVFKLSKEGFDCTIAKNGQEAMDKLAEQSFHLLILDIMMPVLDGWEVLKRVRSDERWKKLPVLILTAKGLQKDMANAAEMGATEYLKKPFNPEELSGLASRMTGRTVK